MSEQEKFFVVVNPTLDEHVALDRAIITAQLMTPRPKIVVFVAIDHDSVDMSPSNDNIYRNTDWFDEQIHSRLKAADLDYQIEIFLERPLAESHHALCAKGWRNTYYYSCRQAQKQQPLWFTENKWKLFKRAFCPVLLVRDGAAPERKVVLAAVNFQAIRDQQQQLNCNILARGKALAESYGAEFHVVNAYLDSMLYPDRGRLAKETGLDSSNIHVVQGYTDEAIAKVSKDINADVVLIGTLGQTGMIKTMRGNTAERVISALNVDVVVINSEYKS